VILFVLFFYLGLTSLDPLLKWNCHKLWNDGVWVWQRSTDRTHQSAPIATAKQTAASNQDILSQDIEAVVIKQTKKTQPSKETAKEEVKPKPKKIHNLQSTSDALSSILNGPKSNGKAKGGEGMTI
jgi:hypothetical protein